MINISSKVLLITLVSIVTVAMLMITLPIMAEISQLPHDQKNNATTNMPDMLNVTSDEYNNVQASAIIPDLLPQEPDIEPIDVYDGSFPWDANNEFALKMYKNILEKNPDKNIFFSPTSIMIAMAMAYEELMVIPHKRCLMLCTYCQMIILVEKILHLL